jgi:hypothetical protein
LPLPAKTGAQGISLCVEEAELKRLSNEELVHCTSFECAIRLTATFWCG